MGHCGVSKGEAEPLHGHCLLTLNKKAPEHLTKLSFSAAERFRAKGARAAEWSSSGEVTEAEGTGLLLPAPHLSPLSLLSKFTQTFNNNNNN